MLQLSGINETKIKKIMTPLHDIFMLDINLNLNYETMALIYQCGHSRIPVYNPKTNDHDHNHIVGILYVKDLILLDPADEIPLKTILSFYHRRLPYVFSDIPLQQSLDFFKENGSTIAIVQEVVNSNQGDPYYLTVGLITLEDVMSCILQQQQQGKEEEEEKQEENKINNHDIELDIQQTSKINYKRSQTHRIRNKSLIKNGKLKLEHIFSSKKVTSITLSSQEVSAIFYHLTGNISEFKNSLSSSSFKDYIKNDCELYIIDYNPNQSINDDISQDGYNLYTFGTSANYATLILDGKIEIISGRDQFKSYKSRWDILCNNIFQFHIENNNQIITNDYIADFNAKVVTSARILRLNRDKFIKRVQNQLEMNN